MFDFIQKQKELLLSALPSGFEEKLGTVLAELARPHVDEIWFDGVGNLICHKRGIGKKIAIPAHRDVIGFIVRRILPSGALKIIPIGGHSAAKLTNTPVRFENGVRGVTYKCVDEAESPSDVAELYIDIGAVSEQESAELVQVGDVAVFDTPCVRGGGDTVMTPYADDLVGCAVLLRAMELLKETKNDLYFIFSVREEIGTQGADVAAWGIEPDICIAVDVTDALDEPCSEQPRNILFGKGPSIAVRDASIYNPAVYRTLRMLAEQERIPYQEESLPFGGTDAGAFMDTKSGIAATVVSIPVRGMHSPQEIFDQNDAENTARLIAAACSCDFPEIRSLRRL